MTTSRSLLSVVRPTRAPASVMTSLLMLFSLSISRASLIGRSASMVMTGLVMTSLAKVSSKSLAVLTTLLRMSFSVMIPTERLSSTMTTAPVSSLIMISTTLEMEDSGVDCGGSGFMLLVTGNLRSASEYEFNAPIKIN